MEVSNETSDNMPAQYKYFMELLLSDSMFSACTMSVALIVTACDDILYRYVDEAWSLSTRCMYFCGRWSFIGTRI